ncbi:zinc finger protein RFP-like [Alligator sinensis]|uniref:Zinc finger protein RFP-like n=1 Tax=Alligator sinensis TaxID=38654 RepID=A0A1U7RLP4_ALLSI|nr:zinc finger protein RFP-like [Alligator sinensis]
MAAEEPLGTLDHEATCPICLEFFTEPVTLTCGHNFCQSCITQYWEKSGPNCSCPQCRQAVRQRTLSPNWQLTNVVEIVKQLKAQAAKGTTGQRVCEQHQEDLKLFCKEDQTLICVVCHLSRAHRTHTIVPVEEATQEYQERFQAHLRILREEKEKFLTYKLTGEKRIQECLKQTEVEKEKIVSEFQQLHLFLNVQEQLLLTWLGKLVEEMEKIKKENVTKLSKDINHIDELIHELEGKYQQPANEFLQDIRSSLSRYKKGMFQLPVEIYPNLEKRLTNFSKKNAFLMRTLKKFKDTMSSELRGEMGKPQALYTKAIVTLDQDTAHPNLVLSLDRKSVKWENTVQRLPDNPKRFDNRPCVLGSERFTSGRHYWEVDVGEGKDWAVGVARESVRRKGQVTLNPEGGIWAVECDWDQFHALTFPEVTLLPLSQVPRKISVFLDYERGGVRFYHAGSANPIFIFPPASFNGEGIHPWFWAVSQLSLNS